MFYGYFLIAVKVVRLASRVPDGKQLSTSSCSQKSTTINYVNLHKLKLCLVQRLTYQPKMLDFISLCPVITLNTLQAGI